MASQKDFDALAERIKAGIAKTGCHILTQQEMEILWHRMPVEKDEKRLIIQNFAAHYNFIVDLSPGLVIAAFQNPG